ncbi:MAG: CAF17-like 4Fe-4S cluster assembly/insertion protein YgfZ [Alphaproteobacteria bacterium]
MKSRSRCSAALEDRGVVALSGADANEFLQGIVTNNVEAVTERRAVYGALLTPQGKFLHDFFLFRIAETLYLDCEAARRDDLMRRLKMYRLRADVGIEDAGASLAVYALFGDGAAGALGIDETEGAASPFGGGAVYTDPRTASLGVRAALPPDRAASVLAEAGFADSAPDAYDSLRIGLGVPDGSHDMELEKSLPLEYGFDDLNGVDFEKGCFIGQEVTARMKRRGLVRKRLLPVDIDGGAPAPGAPVMRGDVEVGEMRASSGHSGLALLRLDRIAGDGAELTAGGARIAPHKPGWIHLPD